MFWKSVNFGKLKSWSLVSKLMLLYTFSTLSILMVIGLFLYPTFAKVIHQVNQAQVDSVSAECFEKVIIALLLGSVVIIIAGYVVARNGLRRVDEFADKMTMISAHSLDERIDPNDWPRELKTLAEKFNVMLERIQISFAQLSQFSADLAHELRSPIHNLLGITETALVKDKSLAEYKQILYANYEEYQYLSKLIDSLFFLAHAEHGQIALEKVCVNARTEILTLCDYFQAIADEKNIKLVCEGHEDVFVDPTLFKRVVNNLLSNAFRYTMENGEIKIKIESQHQNHVQVAIHDTGIGIDEIHLSKIFDRFYRIDSSRSVQSGGLGLGLTIVKSIMDLHDGKIKLESQPNKGTSVYLQFPTF